jgi:hypothetical protein
MDGFSRFWTAQPAAENTVPPESSLPPKRVVAVERKRFTTTTAPTAKPNPTPGTPSGDRGI